jgi:hypothetical protein
MAENFRHFSAGPDPSGRRWQVDLMWLQTAIAIRHSDSIDVKFLLWDGDIRLERVISLRHADLLELSRARGREVTDPWCASLAARHLTRMIETGEDLEKTLVTPDLRDLAEYGAAERPPA